jgi:DNA-binding GntR family transcriptional regulator
MAARSGRVTRETRGCVAAGNDPAQAREHLTAGRAIMAGLVEKFPDRAAWKTDLAWFDEQISELK